MVGIAPPKVEVGQSPGGLVQTVEPGGFEEIPFRARKIPPSFEIQTRFDQTS
jgi:hypothetical protein